MTVKEETLKGPAWRFFVPMVLTLGTAVVAHFLPSWGYIPFLICGGLAALFFVGHWSDPWVRRSYLAMADVLLIVLMLWAWDRWTPELRMALGMGYALFLSIQDRCWGRPSPLARGWKALGKGRELG